MSEWHGYLAVEDIDLTQNQGQTLRAEFERLGPASHPQPSHLCHWRISLDDRKAIFEAEFETDNISIERTIIRLADLFGVSTDTISVTMAQRTFAARTTPIVTYRYLGTDKFRLATFGGFGASWDESRIETHAYLALHPSEWEEEIEAEGEELAAPVLQVAWYRRPTMAIRSAVGRLRARL